MLRHAASLALLVAASTFSPLASAAFISSSSLTNLRFELVDLEPGDGIDPSLALAYQSKTWAAVASTVDGPVDIIDEQLSSDLNPMLRSQGAVLGAQVTATINGNDMRVHGSLFGPGEHIGSAERTGTFSLSAHTAVRITGHTSVTTTAPLLYPEYNIAGVNFSMISLVSTDPDRQAVFYQHWANSFPNDVSRIEEDFALLFTNPGGSTMDGTLNISVGATGQSMGVPEPGTASTVLCGLALLGALTLRRQRLQRQRGHRADALVRLG